MLHLTEDQSFKAAKFETYCEMLEFTNPLLFFFSFPAVGINLHLKTPQSGFNLVSSLSNATVGLDQD